LFIAQFTLGKESNRSAGTKAVQPHFQLVEKRKISTINFAKDIPMPTVPKIIPKPIILAFFLVGVLSSIAFRVIIILQKLRPAWVRPVWYFGVLGYMAFFIYRFYISQRRKRVIAQSEIIGKLRGSESLSPDDRAAALYLLSSIQKSPEDWNYLAIFVLSIVAIVIDCLT
jgi:hypothetical protein